MDMLTLIIIGLAISAAMVVILLAMAIYQLTKGADADERRLQGLQLSGKRADKKKSGVKRIKQRMVEIAKFAAPKSDKAQDWEKSKLRDDLVTAGFRSVDALNIFIGIRIAALILLPAITFAVGILNNTRQPALLISTLVAAAVGYILPGYILEKKAASRAAKIASQMPQMLDLLVIAVESGLGLDAAVQRVSKDIVQSSPILAQELAIFSLELKLGASRADALRNLAKRCGVDEMGSLVAMLVQADRFGVSVGRSIRVFSDEMRTKRRQQMEEKAAKIPLKLLFPVLFMIFPAIMAVMAGPALINIMENMF